MLHIWFYSWVRVIICMCLFGFYIDRFSRWLVANLQLYIKALWRFRWGILSYRQSFVRSVSRKLIVACKSNYCKTILHWCCKSHLTCLNTNTCQLRHNKETKRKNTTSRWVYKISSDIGLCGSRKTTASFALLDQVHQWWVQAGLQRFHGLNVLPKPHRCDGLHL